MLKKRQRPVAAETRKSASLADLIARYGVGDHGGGVAPPSYNSNVVAYRCIRMIAESAASVPLLVREHAVVQFEGRIRALLDNPNPDETGSTLLEQVYGFLQTHGNAYIERLDQGLDTRAVFALHPASMEQTHDGYLQRLKKGNRHFRPDISGRMNLLHLTLWQPTEVHRGLAPLQVAAEAMHLHNAACAWNRQLIDNAARPSGALVHNGGADGANLTPDQFDRLKEELEMGFTGLRGAGRPLLLDGGLDWRPMGLTPAEMDFQNLKNSAARDIALAFGVPPMLLGIPGDNTYANYREANLAFWRQTVLPLVGKVTSALAHWLDDSRSTSIEPDISRIEALGPERSSRLDRIAQADFLTDNEKRAALGFPALESDMT